MITNTIFKLMKDNFGLYQIYLGEHTMKMGKQCIAHSFTISKTNEIIDSLVRELENIRTELNSKI